MPHFSLSVSPLFDLSSSSAHSAPVGMLMSRSSWLKWFSLLSLSLSVSAGDAEAMAGQREARSHWDSRKKFYILGDSALLGDYKGFNWRMKGSKVVSDISGLGIWQSAAWSPAKSPGPARKC